MPLILLVFAFMLSNSMSAVHEEVAVSMVPRGKYFENIGRDYIVKTPAGTKIEIAFKLDGKFKEASGRNLNKGDDLEPGDGLISLSTAAQKIQGLGRRPEGHWMLENDKQMGWIYEVNDQFIVSAKTGEILKK